LALSSVKKTVSLASATIPNGPLGCRVDLGDRAVGIESPDSVRLNS
jgi:hypothetical protein